MDVMKMDKLNMAERYCALVIGILFLILGIAGFIPALLSVPGTNASYIPADVAPGAYSAGFGYLFGIFPTNFLHNLVHAAVGIFGIASYTSASSARVFNRFFAVSYILIAILGMIPAANTVFGLMPIFGGNVLLNGLTAVAALYYGIVLPAKLNDVAVVRNI